MCNLMFILLPLFVWHAIVIVRSGGVGTAICKRLAKEGAQVMAANLQN